MSSCIFGSHSGEDGSALVMTLAILMFLSILGTTALNSSNSELMLVGDSRRRQKAFFIAESGIEFGKQYLYESMDNGTNLNSIITGGAISKTVGDGNFNLYFEENATDDDFFWMISNGTYSNAKKQIKLYIEKDRSDIDMEADAAFGVYTPNATMTMKGNPLISGDEYDIPDDFDCSGAGCNGLATGVSGKPSLYFAEEPYSLSYNPSKHLSPDFDYDTIGTSDKDNEYWQDFAEALLPYADRTITPTDNVEAFWGTREDPDITVVDGKKINSTIDGAGVLILKNGADITGNFHFEGVAICLVQEGDTIEMFSAAGTPDIFGTVVVAGETPDEIHFEEITYTGNARVKYSSEALGFAYDAIPPDLIIISWQD